jgi:hypothetical protein
MPEATRESIRAALYARLQTKLVASGGPFASVHHRAEGRGQERALDREVVLLPTGSLPAAILGFERETFAPEVETLAAADSYVGTSVWRVYVVVSELRGHAEAIEGSGETASAGVDDCVTAIETALAGFAIANLYPNPRVRLIDSAPASSKSGQYVHVVRVSAQRCVDADDIPETVLPFTGVDADLHLEGVDPEDDDPVTVARARPPHS